MRQSLLLILFAYTRVYHGFSSLETFVNYGWLDAVEPTIRGGCHLSVSRVVWSVHLRALVLGPGAGECGPVDLGSGDE